MQRRLLMVIGNVLSLLLTCCANAQSQELQRRWARSPSFDELDVTVADGKKLRFHINVPEDAAGRPARATRLIIYALPNGNTIEQTLGCKRKQGLDWRYDIQHVAAQVRLLRTHQPNERIVLVCAEAQGLSWPSWRRDRPEANAIIRRLVDEWREEFGDTDARVTLTGHSGGGSFMFGVIEASDAIPNYIDRIAFLDANYAFDATLHADKLSRWLTADETNRLIVVAYDDREITLDGKKVVGPTGGTFRATVRMRDALGDIFPLNDVNKPPFREATGLGGRIHFSVHPNPENRILHTALVGEMNGLVHAQTVGAAVEVKWGTFGGPRAYEKWIQPEPTADAREAATHNPPSHSGEGLGQGRQTIPRRPGDAPGGRAFLESLHGLSLDQREAAILGEIVAGNFPEFLRTFQSVSISGSIHSDAGEQQITATLEVMPDYLAVGSDADFVRMPMRPQTAQQIADRFGCVLPTRKIVDAIDRHAELRLAPHPLTHQREAVATFLEHHEIIERQRAGKRLGLLVSGIKKDIVLSPRIFERPNRLAIYGWRQPGGKPIQPLTIVHSDRYVDYSHGVRLVRNAAKIEGETVKITDLLVDPLRCGLVSDEGPIPRPAYPRQGRAPSSPHRARNGGRRLRAPAGPRRT